MIGAGRAAISSLAISASARQWVSEVVGSGAELRVVTKLPGATSSDLYAIEGWVGQRPFSLVLRLFTNADWLAEEPDLAQHEAAALSKAAAVTVPVPQLVAYDTRGERCGVPAVLMTRLPGNVQLRPADRTGWLRQLAAALAAVHAVAADGFAWMYTTWNDVAALRPPDWSPHPALWARMLARLRGPQPPFRPRFIHRDYHPTNVLWQDGRVSGVVDWVNACRGPAGIDVGHCRLNLAALYGAAVANQFLHAYRALAGDNFAYHPYWDWLSLIEFLPHPGVYPGWGDFGINNLTLALVRQHLDDYLMTIAD